MTTAKFETKRASLASDFGEGYARRLFGAAVDQLPRYTRGPKAGKPKGEVVWVKCVAGGWVGQGAIPDGGGAVGGIERRRGKVISARLYSEDGFCLTWELDPHQPAPLYLYR